MTACRSRLGSRLIARRLFVAIFALAASSCSRTAGKAGLGPAAPIKERPDRGPVLTRRDGALAAPKDETLEFPATFVQEAGDHLYVAAAPLPEAQQRAARGLGSEGIYYVRPSAAVRYGLGVRQGDELLIRLAGVTSRPTRLELDEWPIGARSPNDRLSPVAHLIVVVTAIHEAKPDPVAAEAEANAAPGGGSRGRRLDLEARFFDALGPALARHGSRGVALPDPFFAYAHYRSGLVPQRGGAGVTRLGARRPEVGELMSLYTGWRSVEEALQTDRALLTRGDRPKERTIPIATLKGVPLAEHPWAAMLAELPGKPQPVIEPLGAAVPSDVLYLHFHDLRTLGRLMKDIEPWASPLWQIIDNKAGATHFIERYERQLAIEHTGLADKLGHLAASGIAFVSSDPFWREGTDLSLVFKVRTQALIDGVLELYEKRTRERRPDARVSTYEVSGNRVRLLATEDREVFQHRLQLGDVLIVSNSRPAIERFVAVQQGKLAALKDSGDFRYMRARYPFDPQSEDGFAFAGDALVAHVVSPRVKILQARRMEARADLAAAGYAALLFGWLEGRRAKDVGELLASRVLRSEDLEHVDGAAITLDLDRGARSAFGSVARLVPLCELDIDRVTPEEAQAYNQFQRSYQQNWVGFIDPIAARITRGADGRELAIDARMLPLIASSDYDDLIREVGIRTINAEPKAVGLQWTLAVGDDAELRRFTNDLVRGVTRSQKIGIDWLGDWVMVGASDRSGLWDLALWAGDVPSAGPLTDAPGEAQAAQVEVLGHLPLFAGAQVRDKFGLAAALMGLHAYADTSAPGVLEWVQDEPYRSVPITMIREPPAPPPGPNGPGRRALPRFGIVLRYGVVGDMFLAALEREVLEEQIDAVLDGAPAAPGQAAQAIVTVRPARADGWLVKSLAGLLESATLVSNRGAFRAAEALARGLGGMPQGQEGLRRYGLAYLGYEPRCANGGSFGLRPDGLVEHSLYGTEVTPILPPLPVKGAPVTGTLRLLEALDMRLSFEGEGTSRGLHAKMTWRHRPSS